MFKDQVKELTEKKYTGYTKDGAMIYEGDIIEELTVSYCNGKKEFNGMEIGWYLERDDFESWIEFTECDDLLKNDIEHGSWDI